MTCNNQWVHRRSLGPRGPWPWRMSRLAIACAQLVEGPLHEAEAGPEMWWPICFIKNWGLNTWFCWKNRPKAPFKYSNKSNNSAIQVHQLGKLSNQIVFGFGLGFVLHFYLKLIKHIDQIEGSSCQILRWIMLTNLKGWTPASLDCGVEISSFWPIPYSHMFTYYTIIHIHNLYVTICDTCLCVHS